MLITIPENPSRSYHHLPLNQTSSAPQRRSTDQSLRKTKLIGLQRSLNSSYGFHLRGGREHGTGFFISHVDVGSEAYRKGLRTGDQVIKVNNYNIGKSLHKEVASIVQTSREVLLEVKSTGIIPVKNSASDPLCWIPVQNDEGMEESQPYSLKSNSSSQSSISSLPNNPLFIVMSGAGKSTIGCSICKGPSEKPGIFVQKIIDKGVADEAGLRPGDQILSCNGRSFLNIEFQQAVQTMKSAPCLRMEILRGAGLDLISGESSGYNSSVSSEEENYPSSECDSYRHIYADANPQKSSSTVFLDAHRDWKEIEAEWADAEVSEKRSKLHRTALPAKQQIPPSKSLLNLSINNHDSHSSKNRRQFGNELSLPKQTMRSNLSTARSMSDIRSAKGDDSFKIALQTTSDVHVSKIVVPSVPKSERNALLRLEQLSSPASTLQKGAPKYNPTSKRDPEISTPFASTTSSGDTKAYRPTPPAPPSKETKPHIRLQRTHNLSKMIDSQQLINDQHLTCSHIRDAYNMSSEESDQSCPSSKISVSSENGKFTSKILIRSAPPAPPPRGTTTKLSRNKQYRCNHRPFLRTGSNPLTSLSRMEMLTPPASPSISSGSSDYHTCGRVFERHKSFGSLSASSDESGAWEDIPDTYISHSSIQVSGDHKNLTLPRSSKSGTLAQVPPPPPMLKKSASSVTSSIPAPPPPPPPPMSNNGPSLGDSISKEIQRRQEQQGNGLKKVDSNNLQRKPPIEDPKKHQHEKLMEEFKKKHAMMFNKKRNDESESENAL